MKFDLVCAAKVCIVVVCTALGTTAFVFAGGSRPTAAGAVIERSFAQSVIYTANCARCHGADGRANTPKGKELDATDLTSDWNRDEARAVRIVTNGKGDMPSFKKRLNARQIKSVVAYVRRFKS